VPEALSPRERQRESGADDELRQVTAGDEIGQEPERNRLTRQDSHGANGQKPAGGRHEAADHREGQKANPAAETQDAEEPGRHTDDQRSDDERSEHRRSDLFGASFPGQIPREQSGKGGEDRDRLRVRRRNGEGQTARRRKDDRAETGPDQPRTDADGKLPGQRTGKDQRGIAERRGDDHDRGDQTG